MHAIRGTVGYDPTPIDPEAKRASRTRFFEGLNRPLPVEAEATAGAIERNVRRTEEQRRLESIVASGKRPGLASYQKALATLDQAIAELDGPSPLTTADLGAYGISD